MAEKVDLSFGDIAVKMGLITRPQMEKCLKVQSESEQLKWKPLGLIMADEGYLTKEQVTMIVNIQKRNIEIQAVHRRRMTEDNIFGRIVIKLGYATESQVEECLGVQLVLGNDYFLRLGEIMVKKGFLTESQVTEVMAYQESRIVTCPKCNSKYNAILFNPGKKFICYKCNNELKTPA